MASLVLGLNELFADTKPPGGSPPPPRRGPRGNPHPLCVLQELVKGLAQDRGSAVHLGQAGHKLPTPRVESEVDILQASGELRRARREGGPGGAALQGLPLPPQSLTSLPVQLAASAQGTHLGRHLGFQPLAAPDELLAQEGALGPAEHLVLRRRVAREALLQLAPQRLEALLGRPEIRFGALEPHDVHRGIFDVKELRWRFRPRPRPRPLPPGGRRAPAGDQWLGGVQPLVGQDEEDISARRQGRRTALLQGGQLVQLLQVHDGLQSQLLPRERPPPNQPHAPPVQSLRA